MKLFWKIVICISVLLIIMFGINKNAFAKRDFLSEYTQEQYTNENGLPTTGINDIIQTDDGYMWIGSYNGLIRYDGTKFKVYNSKNTENLQANSVNSLFEDSKKRLWIGSNDCGIFLYDKGVFKTIEKGENISALSVRAISEDSNGNIILGTNDGIYLINNDLEIVKIKLNDGFNNVIKGLVCDVNDNIWVVDSTGKVYVLKPDGSTKKINTNYSTCVCKGKNDEILIGTSKDELIKIKVNNEEFKPIIYKTDNKVNIKNARYDSCNRLWISFDNGMGFIDINGDFKSIDGAKIENSVENIYEDFEENIWIVSSREGLLKLSKSKFKNLGFEMGFKNDIVNSTIKYQDNLYIASDSGLTILNKNEIIENELTDYLKGHRIRNLIVDSKNNLWISTYDTLGIIKYNGSEYKTINTTNSELTTDKVRCAIEGKDNSIIVGTNNGINIIKDDEIVRSYTANDGLVNGVVLSLCTDDEGRIYAGSDGSGIYVIENDEVKNYSKEIGLDSGVILRVVRDKNQDKIIVSTGSSLYYFKDGEVEKINLDIGDNSVYDIKFANNNGVWFIGTNGVYLSSYSDMVSNQNIKCKLYGNKHGLTSIPTTNSWSYLDGSGNLYMCCTKGVNVINTLEINRKNMYPKIEINSVEADNIISKEDKAITIGDDCKKINIDIDILSFSKGYDGKVVYYLEGFDTSPIEITKGNNTAATYTNLKGGKYKFYVEVLDDDGNVQMQKVINIDKKLGIFEYNLVKTFVIILLVLFIFASYETMVRTKNEKIRKKQEEYSKFVDETVKAIANTIDAKDKYTNGHSQRVAYYSAEIAKRLKLTQEKVKDIYYIALLHDIGKIGIPDYILNKPDKLTTEEFEIIKTHTIIGWSILKDVNFINNLADGAKYHHERYDGHGYMEGLKGKEIPLVARIICVADTYDAMSSDRVYRKGLSDEIISEEFKKYSGKQFDPEIAKLMIQIIEEKSAKEDLVENNIQLRNDILN